MENWEQKNVITSKSLILDTLEREKIFEKIMELCNINMEKV